MLINILARKLTVREVRQQPMALEMALQKLHSQANSTARRSSSSLRARARIYLQSFQWREELERQRSAADCNLCAEFTSVERQMFLVRNYQDEHLPPNACPHMLCCECHLKMRLQLPDWTEVFDEDTDELRFQRETVTRNRTRCPYCRVEGRFL